MIVGFGFSEGRATDLYWDTNGATTGLGSATTPANWSGTFWNTDGTGGNGGTVTTWTNSTSNNAILAGAAGTLTIDTGVSSGVTMGTLTVNSTGYKITSASNGRPLSATSLVLADGVGMTLDLNSTGGAWTLGGATFGTGATLTVSGIATAANANKIILNAATTISGGAITLAGTAAGVTGFVSSTAAVNINTVITNNSATSATMLGASSTGSLVMGARVTGSAGLQFGGTASNPTGGAGTITLNAANDYTGATTFNAAVSGLIKLGIDNALPTGTDVTMAASTSNGGIFDLNGHDQTIGSLTSGVGGGSITNNAAGTGLNTLTIGGSTSPAAFGLAITNGATARTALTRSGTGTTILTGANTYTGGTLVSGGALTVNSGGTIGAATGALTVSAANGVTSTLNLNVDQTVGSLAGTTAGSGTATINIASAKTLTANQAGNTTFGGVLAGSGGKFTKDGAGTLTFTGTQTYTGATTITAGTLNVNGTLDAASAVGVSGILSGSGTVNGAVTINGGGRIAPGSGGIGILTLAGGLSLSVAGANYTWELGALTTSGAGTNFDQIVLSGGALTIGSGATLALDFTALAGGSRPGAGNAFWNSAATWKIIDVSGASTGSFSAPNISLVNATTAQGAFSTAIGTGPDAGDIFLNFTPGSTSLTWTGGPGTWSASGGTSWSGGAWNATKTAIFNAGSGVVALGDPITANGLQFDVTGYTISGAGANTLSAPTVTVTNAGDVVTIGAVLASSSLNKTGAGKLILAGTQSYGGGTTVTAGTLQGDTASLQGDIINNGAVIFDQATLGTYAGNMSGSGSLTKQNAGTLVLTGTNSYLGGTNLNGGIVSINSDARLGGAGGLAFGGGTLQTSAGIATARAIAVNASGGTFDTNGFDSTLSNTITFSGGGFTKSGAGELAVTAGFAGISASGVSVTGGTLTLGDKTNTSANPKAFLTGNPLLLSNGAFTIAASSSGNSSLTIPAVTSSGTAQITLYRTASGAPNSMTATLTTDGVTLSASNGVPLNVSGQLTVAAGGNINSATPAVVFGATTLTGNTTFVLTANSTVTTNLNLGGSGSGTAAATASGTIADNGHALTVLGGGSGTQLGGQVRLNNAGTLTGTWTIGDAGGTQGAVVAVNNAGALTTGNITVHPYSQLLFNVAGSYGVPGQTLTLHGIGAQTADLLTGNSGPLRAASGASTFAGDLALASDPIVAIAGAATTFTLNGNLTGSGQLQKQGAGNLILAGTANTASGGTRIGNGTVTVNAGSSLGSGDVFFSQTGSNNTALVLGNTAQTIGNLASSFAAASGSQTQSLTLNGTALTIVQSSATTFGDGLVATLAGTIDGNGSLKLAAASTGALTLTGTNTYTGPTTVEGGKLFVGGLVTGSASTVSGSIDGSLVVKNGGTLGGLGTVGDITLESGAKLAPGTDAPPFTRGTLTGTSLFWNGGSTLRFELSATDNTSDKLSLGTGVLTKGAGNGFAFDFLGSGLAGQTYVLLTFGSHGAFTEPDFSFSNLASGLTGSFHLTNTNLSFATAVVPEPGAGVFLVSGLAILASWRRRAQKSHR